MLKIKRILALVLVMTLVCANVPWTAAAAAFEQADGEVVLTEQTVLPEEMEKKEEISTDAPASNAVGMPSVEVYIQAPEYQIGDRIPAPDEIALDITGGIRGEVSGFWEYGEEEVFQSNRYYYLELSVIAPEGVTFDWDTLELRTNGCLASTNITDGSVLHVTLEYDMYPPRVGEVWVHGLPQQIQCGEAQLPMDLSVKGEATIISTRWLDEEAEETDSFVDGHDYFLELVVVGNDGYWLDPYASVYDADMEPNHMYLPDAPFADVPTFTPDENKIRVYRPYSLKQSAGPVQISVSGVAPGLAVEDVQVQAIGEVEIDYYSIKDMDADEELETGTFEREKYYTVLMQMNINEGFTHLRDIEVALGECENIYSWNYIINAWSLTVVVEYDFSTREMGYFSVEGMPEEIQPGDALIPELYATTGVRFSQIRWLDADKQPVTEFTDGNYYYLEVTMETEAGYVFAADVKVDNWQMEGNYQCVSERKIVATCRYSLEPAIDAVALSVFNVEVGKQVGDIIAEVSNVAAVENIEVFDLQQDKYLSDSDIVEDNMYLQVTVALKANDGYRFTYDTKLQLTTSDYYSSWISGGGQLMFAAVEFDLRDPAIRNLWVGGLPEELQPGVNQLPDLYVEEGHCAIDSVRWMDEEGQTVTSMEANKVYGLEVIFTPDDGYAFRDYVYLDCDKYEILDNGNLCACWVYSLVPVIGNVEVNVSGVALGAPVSGVDVQVTEGAVIDNYYFTCGKGEVTDGYFEESEYYELVITLYPPEGFRFSRENCPYVNGSQDYGYSMGPGGSSMVIYVTYDFYKPAVENIWVDQLPTNEDIAAGTAQIPTLQVKDGYATIESVRWVDENKQPVTTFVKGNDYFLEITFAPVEGYEFRDSVYIEQTTTYDELQIVSPEKLVYYRGYSLKPSVDTVNLQVSGYAVGQSVSKLKVEAIGNAKVVSTVIYNETSGRPVTSGNFEAGQVYLFEFVLEAVDGYRFADDTKILINDGDLNAYQNDGGRLHTGMYFNTCEMIDSVTLNMGKVEIGKNVDAYVPTAPNGAKYSVEYYYWTDHTSLEEVNGKFEDGHKYYLGFILRPAKGYAFSGDLTVTVGGQKADVWVSEIGAFCEGGATYSFLKKITKVELPAMPDSIRKGSTLPDNFKVSSSKYNLEHLWISVLDDEAVTKVEKDGSYVLAYFADAAKGYEFAEDVDVYIGGKLSKNIIMEGSTIQAFKVYNLGVPEVKRVDLTIPEPAVGEKPGKVTVAAGANYEVGEAYWYQNTSGEVYDSDDEVKTFQNGKFVLLTMSIAPAEGYFLSSELEIYVNGKKMTDSLCVSMSTYGAFAVNLGEVGVVRPMQAPVVKVEGQMLTWQADSDATGYEIYRATSKSGKYTKVGTTEANVWMDDSATVGKTYYYKVKAVNAGNTDLNSGYSGVVSMAAKCAAPAAEVHVDSESGKPRATWNKVSGAKKYEVWRADAVDGKYTKLTTTTALTYTDTKAAVGVEYYYKVKAIASKSTYNSDFSGIWMSSAICAKPVVSAKADSATGKPILSWKAVSGANAYQILRQTGTEEFVPVAMCEGVTWLDTTAVVDTQYTYKIQALGPYDGCNSVYSNAVEVTCSLACPNFIAEVNDNGKPSFTWEAVEGAVVYQIYRSTSATKSYKLVQTTAELTYIDESVAAGKTYYYKLEAVGENSKSAQSAYVKLTGKCGIPELKVEAGSTGKPVLTWNKISGAKKYEIWRSVDGAAFKKLTTATKTTYTDTKATNGAECIYKVKALGSKSSYNGLFSVELGCYVTCAAPTLTVKIDTATGKPSLSWSKVTGATGYDIYRSENGGGFEKLTNVTDTTYLDEATDADNSYTYYVVTVGKAEVFNSVNSAEKTVTVTVGQPKLVGSIDEQGKAVITWQAVEDALQYEVYRSTSSSKSYKLVDTVTELTYTDTGITAGKTYYYKVVAVGSNSKSAQSAYVKLTGKCAQPVINVQIDETSGKPVIGWGKISGAKKYEIYRSTDGVKFSKLTTTTKLTYTDSKATVGTEYTYKVKAVGSKSSYNSIDSTVLTAIAKCAMPVVTLKIDAVTGKPTLTWKAVSGATEYGIYFDDGEGYSLINVVEDTKFTHEDAYPGRICRYYVVAYGTSHAYDSAWAKTDTVTATCAKPVLEGGLTPDGKPYGSWEDVTGADSYKVYRSTKSSSGYKVIDISTEGNLFFDLSAKKGKTYYYKITAVVDGVESAQSNYIKVKSK